MFMQHTQVCKREKGFTLIELMIVVAIIGILAAVAVPNFITYRNKSRVAATIGTGESIRAAFASYAADSVGNLYPINASITNYATLLPLTNRNGGSLAATPVLAGFTVTSYDSFDTDADGVADSYSMRVVATGVPNTLPGYQVLVTPGAIQRCAPGAAGLTTAGCAQ